MNNLKKYLKENFEKLEYLDMYSKAELIVRAVFKNIRDKGGNPYLDHLYYVSDHLKDINMKIVGLLHDLIEDTDITYNDLLEVGFTKNIIDAVELLTKKEEYDKYIDRIINSNNKIALMVKKVDLENNMDLSRIKKPTIKDYDRLNNKYKPQYKKIVKKIKEMER